MTKRFLMTLMVISFLIISCENRENTITIIGENSSTIQAMQFLRNEYEKKTDQKLDFKPSSFEDSYQKSNQDFVNGTGLYDIILQYNFSLSSFVRNDYVYTLDELKSEVNDIDYSFEEDIFPRVWKEVGYYYKNTKEFDQDEVQIVSYPFAANTMMLVYNKELFSDDKQRQSFYEKYGRELHVPNDLKSFKEVAEFFTQPENDLKGVCLQGATGGWLYYEWCSFLQGFGGKVLDKDVGWKGNGKTKVLIDSEEAYSAAKYYVSLKPYNAGNFFTTDGVEQRNLIKTGKVAMGIIWSDYAWGLVNEDNGFDKRFAFAPTPGNKSMIAGGAYFVNKKTDSKEESFRYITDLLKRNTQIEMIKHGLCAPTMSAYEDEEARKVPYVPALKESLMRAEYMLEAGPDADLINNIITKYLQKFWNRNVGIKDGLNAAKVEIEQGRGILFN